MTAPNKPTTPVRFPIGDGYKPQNPSPQSVPNSIPDGTFGYQPSNTGTNPSNPPKKP